MDRQTLLTTILREARRDFFNGKGRIFMNEFLRTYEVSKKEFLEAIRSLNSTRLFLDDNIFFINFTDSHPIEE